MIICLVSPIWTWCFVFVVYKVVFIHRAKNMKKKLQFLRRRHTDTSLGVTLRGENGKICHLNQEDIQQWSKSFEALLTDRRKYPYPLKLVALVPEGCPKNINSTNEIWLKSNIRLWLMVAWPYNPHISNFHEDLRLTDFISKSALNIGFNKYFMNHYNQLILLMSRALVYWYP